MAQVPESVITAARRVVGPAAAVGRACRLLAIAALAGGSTTAATIGLGAVGRTLAGLVVTVIAAVILGAPGWWLRQAGKVLAEVADLPDWLASATDVPRIPVRNRADLEALRDGGIVGAVRTIRSTITEVTDYLGPASSIVAVASPAFWGWTGVAAAVGALLVPIGLVCGLGWMLWLAF